MIKEIFKTTLAGILAGLALFVLPFFFIRILIFFLLVGAIFRLLGGRRRMYRYACGHPFHNMSEEERKNFMAKYGSRCSGYDMSPETEPNKENKTTEEQPK